MPLNHLGSMESPFKRLVPRVSAVNLQLPWSPRVQESDSVLRQQTPAKISTVIKDWAGSTGWDSNSDEQLLAPYVNRRVREMAFATTIRHMNYRAFQRAFVGAHMRSWSPLNACLLCAFAAFLNLNAYQSVCDTPFWAIFTYIAVVIIYIFITILVSLPPLVYKALSLTSILIILFIVINLATQSQWFPDIANSQKGDYWGQGCDTSGLWIINHWTMWALLGVLYFYLLCSIFWRYLVLPIGQWHHLKSPFFLYKWRVSSVRVSKVLVPTSPMLGEYADEPNRLKTGAPTRHRFRLVKGVHIELVGTVVVYRLGRFISRLCSCWSSFQADKKNEAPVSKARRQESRWYASYTGEIDSLGRPHGFGYWRGDAVGGETFVGFWREGLPSGPSKSRVIVNGSGFMCIRIGYCDMSGGLATPLKFGVATVECSVSGLFYREFPQVHMTQAPVITDRGETNVLKKAGKKLQKMVAAKKHKKGFKGGPKAQSATLAPTPNLEHSRLPRNTIPPPGPPQRSTTLDSYGQVVPAHRGGEHSAPTLPLDDIVIRMDNVSPRWEEYQNSMEWLLNELRIHAPSFGLHLTSEISISVDSERGLDILGFVPLSHVYIEDDATDVGSSLSDIAEEEPESEQDLSVKQRSQEISNRTSSKRVRSPAVSISPLNFTAIPSPDHRLTSLTQVSQKGNRHTRLSSMAAQDTLLPDMSPHTPQDNIAMRQLTINIQHHSAIEICRALNMPEDESQELVQEWEDLKVNVDAPELSVQGWVSMANIGVPEVLVYIHGYNSNLTQTLQTLGQMATFGNFPPHLKVLTFVWPAGSGIVSFFQAKHTPEDPRLIQAFLDFLISLRASGVRQFHILCHSMGARMFLKALRTIYHTSDILAKFSGASSAAQDPLGKHQDSWIGKLHLLTTTFMNPEYALEEFISQDYNILRSVCSHITIYADANDGALFWSEFFSRKDALGRSVFGLKRPTTVQPESGMNVSTPPPEHLDQKISKSTEETFSAQPRLRFMHTVSFFKMDCEDDQLGMLDECTEDPKLRRRHHHWRRFKTSSRGPGDDVGVEWLDIDVIDTTFMDTNVHGLRHSFWSLNREIIEDFRELLVTRKRATQRTGRLDRRGGNVWVFRVAPSFLTSIFDA
eukprot:Blabericola_migrator_1__6720@NODE_33_length_18162_cov_161_418900_g29_i0_p1_GENE_NODE_33_length_18162_cov_161_418900_g29_i0NODE_33_length_18162_cov_161_418900_g29_i0_p1_ORF_typecomplete_len1130_score209_68DUF900/PF05990_12/1_1e33Lipase/PF00151_19/0_0018DUF2457/PF10446_9/0_031Abhydrolase_6/PF12697_7/0_07Lipase_2/PF01674_18/0_052DUF676/PF05057_14/0_17Glyco_tranf_2_4/PF13704_6/8_4Glyco_tranf_2_4/PF13704_6/1_2e03Glyco_tranf_2_4/PF13704_6/1_5e04Glyco_tranf_2_4/PF13704_6/1_2e04Glyco_tranf_2_4/PF13704_6